VLQADSPRAEATSCTLTQTARSQGPSRPESTSTASKHQRSGMEALLARWWSHCERSLVASSTRYPRLRLAVRVPIRQGGFRAGMDAASGELRALGILLLRDLCGGHRRC